MTQRNVERLIGRLLTDEEFRERFQESPAGTLDALLSGGWELTSTERSALAGLDREALTAFAHTVDPRIRKVSLSSGSFALPEKLDGKETKE